MKLLHLSDLHLGKRVREYSLLEDQRHILRQILDIAKREQPDAVLIAGDVYDKPVPPGEAVQLLDWFLTQLSGRLLPVLLIGGNHDSPERLAFGASVLASGGIHVAPVFDGSVSCVTLKDAIGPVSVWLMPHLKPALVRHAYPDAQINTWEDAVQTVIAHMPVDPAQRNVLMAHQMVTGAATCESEELSIGGLDQVSAACFDVFDYVALGHIHGPQNIGRETLRYSGTPLKYSFSEIAHQKSVTVVELREKGAVQVRTVPLTPLRDMRRIRGTYLELMDRRSYAGTNTEDYLEVVLTDEQDVVNAMANLRTVYPNIMHLRYDNQRTQATQQTLTSAPEQQSPMELFETFYEQQNNHPMEPRQRELVQKLMETIWEDV